MDKEREKHRMEREKERLSRQFEKRQNLLLGGSILLLLIGLFMLVCLFFSVTDEEMGPASWLGCGVAGAGEFAIGVWGICIARERHVDFTGAEIIVYESKLGLVLGWLLYVIGLLMAALVFGYAITDDGAALILTGVMLLLLFGWAACCCDYRNRRILVNDERVWGTTAFGRSWVFSRSEIKEVALRMSLGSFEAKGRDGEKLFRFESNMHNAGTLFEALDGKVPPWVGEAWKVDKVENWRKLHEIQWTPDQETDQTRRADQIRKGFRILALVDVLLSIFLYFFCPGSILELKYRILLIELLPLAYCVYGWVFNEVMFWIDANASKEWKRRHVGMGPGYVHGALIMLFVTYGVLSLQTNYVAGEGVVWILIGALTALLWLITLFRTRKARLRKLTMALIWFPFLILSMGIVEAGLLAVSRPAEENHYPARIVETRKHTAGRGLPNYYAEIALPEGRVVEAEVSQSIYREINEGEPKVVCEHRGPFGIRFVAVHDP